MPKIYNEKKNDKSYNVSIVVCFVLGYIVLALFLAMFDVEFWDLPIILFMFLGGNLGVWIWKVYILLKEGV
jgi:hypothetical protein